MFESKVTGNQTAALLAPVIISERHSQEIFYAELIITPENPLSVALSSKYSEMYLGSVWMNVEIMFYTSQSWQPWHLGDR